MKSRRLKQATLFAIFFSVIFLLSMAIFIYKGLESPNEDFVTRMIIDMIKFIIGGY